MLLFAVASASARADGGSGAHTGARLGTTNELSTGVAEVDPPEAAQLRQLHGKALDAALRKVLASGRFHGGWEEYVDELFVIVDHLRPSLLSALTDTELLEAMELLRYSTSSADLQRAVVAVAALPVYLPVPLPPHAVDDPSLAPDVYRAPEPRVVGARYHLAGALVWPSSEAQWRFLKVLLSASRDEWGPAEQAALALRFNGSRRALELLRSVEGELAERAEEELQQAAREKKARHQSPFVDDFADVAPRFQYRDAEVAAVSRSVIDEKGKRALVYVTVEESADDPGCVRGYKALLKKIDRRWKIVGVWFEWIT